MTEPTTDRELLELAAKAAGLDDAEFTVFPGMEVRYGLTCAMYSDKLEGETGFGYWDPLESDGCALRLAVKLELDISHCPNTMQVSLTSAGCHLHERVVDGDRLAATRRAIVRAAAMIGASKP